jgi:hypothetical protein
VRLRLTQDSGDLGAAHGADALGEPATIRLLDVSSELALLLALHAVRLTGVFLGHGALLLPFSRRSGRWPVPPGAPWGPLHPRAARGP